MILDNLEFHNVDELEKKDELNGVFLQRFPSELRNNLGIGENVRGRYFAQISQGCEIRFVSAAPFVRLSLSAWETEGQVSIYLGDFFHSTHKIAQGSITTIHLEYPQRLKAVNKEIYQNSRFSPLVWRVCFDKEACYSFNGIESFGYEIRKPYESEKPKYKWLAYGSSLTTGSRIIRYKNSYIERSARLLGFDVFNKGITGTCFLEPSIADYLSQIKDWDIASLELGINMILGFNVAEFTRRVENILVKFARANKPVFVIGVLPFYNAYTMAENLMNKSVEFNNIIKEKINLISSPYIHYFEPGEMLDDYTMLGCDLIHPSDDGHILMGDNLSRFIKSKLQ